MRNLKLLTINELENELCEQRIAYKIKKKELINIEDDIVNIKETLNFKVETEKTINLRKILDD